MKEKETNLPRLNYKEFCAYMKRYEREFNKKESNNKNNKLAYKCVFKDGKRVKYE